MRPLIGYIALLVVVVVWTLAVAERVVGAAARWALAACERLVAASGQ